MFHILELIEQQGLDALLLYLEKLMKDASKKNSSKANRILASDRRIQRMRSELLKHRSESSDTLVHPKLIILKQLLLEQLTNEPESRVLVFVKLRDSVLNIVSYLEGLPLIKAQRFVGQATKSKKDKGISQVKQLQILELFKEGAVNVLIATNVAEEGLDIAECDMVVFFDIVASEIRYIQRKGRTARKKEGKVVLLYTRNTNDEIYLRIALSKMKRMNSNLKNENEFRKKQEVKSFPNLNSKKSTKESESSQSTLQEFMYPYESLPDEESKHSVAPEVIVSLDFPGKFGVRKLLREENVNFKVEGNGMKVEIFGKALLVILNPRNHAKIEKNPIKSSYELELFTYDFEEFSEAFEGEKRLLKQKLTKEGELNGLNIVNIDLPEELIFILKSMIAHQRKEEKLD